MVKINNYSFLKYLNYYDLINKYSLKSVFLVPRINKINLNISIEQKTVVKLKSEYKAFLFYYLHNFCCSKIILNFFTSLKKKLKVMTLSSKVIIDISHKKIFDFIIFLIFLLNNKPLKSKYSQSLVSSGLVSGKPQHQYLYLVFSIPTSIFSSEIEKNKQSINFSNLTMFLNFSLKTSTTVYPLNFFQKNNSNLYTNLFKNIFIFWSLKL